MRILNVTETYAPFFEFGGPPVKVRALSEGLARRGHPVTVVTADWGLEKRLQAPEEKITAERSPFGWRREENGVQSIYIPTWLRYRRVSWNPAVERRGSACIVAGTGHVPESATYFKRCETCPLPGTSICEEESSSSTAGIRGTF